MKNDVYGEPEIIENKNIIANVSSPTLTEEERERRMEIIKRATVRLVLSKENERGQNVGKIKTNTQRVG